MSQLELFPVKQTATDYPEILDVGEWGIKWRGKDIPKPDSSFEGDHVAQFGFSCAGCGASAVNQDPVIHEQNCKRK